MMLKVLLHHFFRYVACAPGSVADGPEVAPPVPLVQRRRFLLESPARPPFEPLDEAGEGLRRRALDVHVDVVFAHHALQNPHVLGVADLHEQVPAAHLDVAREHMVAVLGDPDDVRRQPRDCMPAVPVALHRDGLLARREVCSN